MKLIFFCLVLLFAANQDGCDGVQQSDQSKERAVESAMPTPTATPVEMRNLYRPSFPAQEAERTASTDQKWANEEAMQDFSNENTKGGR